MKIYQAMKAKKKLIAEIDQLKSKIRDNNSHIVGKKVNYDVKDLLDQLLRKTSELVTLKANIMNATMPVYYKLHEMSERKSLAQFFKGVSTNEGLIASNSYRGSDVPQEYMCQLNELEVARLITNQESVIEKMQEELDSFNHTTDI